MFLIYSKIDAFLPNCALTCILPYIYCFTVKIIEIIEGTTQEEEKELMEEWERAEEDEQVCV